MNNRFNLIDQKWIPTAAKQNVSLKDVFKGKGIRDIGGNPVEKISFFKLFLAIAQRSVALKGQPIDSYNNEKLSNICIEYLEQNYNNFFLWGDKPFLQIPGARAAKVKTFNELSIDISTGNSPVLYASQHERDFTEEEIPKLILTLMSFATGGKKTDNSVILTPGYKGKMNEKKNPSTGKAGPSLGFKGYLHSFVLAETLLDTIRINLFDEEYIKEFDFMTEGIGIPPWEEYPLGEDDEIAIRLKNSYMGRLIPMCRFVYLNEDGMHFTEGIKHNSIYDGAFDMSTTVDFSKKKPITLWSDPGTHPWRYMFLFLSFFDSESTSEMVCHQLKNAFRRIQKEKMNCYIWSGGLRVSSKAGEQYCTGDDDYTSSKIFLNYSYLSEECYAKLKFNFEILKKYETVLYFSVRGYFEGLRIDFKKHCEKAKKLYWEFMQKDLHFMTDMVFLEDERTVKIAAFNYIRNVYDLMCPASTPNRIMEWAKNNPAINKGGKKGGRSKKED